MSEQLEFRSEMYFDEKEFRRKRTGMVADGWVASNRRYVPGLARYSGSGSGLDLLILPLFWLFNRTQPEELLVVTWVRPKR